jgi:glycosyltransferase involved in cell wall biosynthesis
LAKKGYDVTLIAPTESNSLVDGIKIISIPTTTSRLKRFLISTVIVYKKVMSTKSMICHFHDPELIPAGLLLRLRGRKVIYDVHEDYPRQIMSKEWISAWFRYPISLMVEIVEWLSSRYFSAIIPVTPHIAARFPPSKTTLVQNYPILDGFSMTHDIQWSSRKHQIIYIGGIEPLRGAIESIQAIGLLNDNNLRMVLAGPFSDKTLEDECKLLDGWKKVDYYSWLERDKALAELTQSKAGLVLFHPIPNHTDAQPNKLYEYMSAGLPVIASDFPLWREIIEGNQCGILVDPLKPQETADAIQWILDHPEQAEQMGKNGRKAVEEKYNWAQEEKKLFELYERLSA